MVGMNLSEFVPGKYNVRQDGMNTRSQEDIKTGGTKKEGATDQRSDSIIEFY